MTPEHLMYDKALSNMERNRKAVLDAVTTLVTKANEIGMVVRVTTIPGPGLPAMGNIDTAVVVEPHIIVTRQLDEMFQAALVADDQARMSCLDGIHSWAAEPGRLAADAACIYCGALYGHPD